MASAARPHLRRLFGRAALCWSALALLGCATYTDQMRSMRHDFVDRDFRGALSHLEKSALKGDRKSLLLYQLEKAMILDRQGARSESRHLLIAADQTIERLYTTSVSNTAASFVFNDSAQDYDGEDYEKVAVHTMLALSFLDDSNLESAGVEARKINRVLAKITAAYGDTHNNYKEDAFARYLAGLIYEARGEYDDAIIDYRKALELYRGPFERFYTGTIPEGLIKGLYALALRRGRSTLVDELRRSYPELTKKGDKASAEGMAQLVVIHEAGHIAVKEAHEFIIPWDRQVIRFSFPVIRRSRHIPSGPIGVEVAGNTYPGDNVADLDAIAYHCLEDRRGRILLKSSARLIAKAQLTDQAYKSFGPLGGLAANVYAAVSETADTRGWTLLPEAFYVTRLWLPAGSHSISVRGEGELNKITSVKLRAGEMRILRAAPRAVASSQAAAPPPA